MRGFTYNQQAIWYLTRMSMISGTRPMRGLE